MLRRLIWEEEAQTLVEYGLLVSLVCVVCVAITTVLGRRIRDIFVTVNQSISSTHGAPGGPGGPPPGPGGPPP